MKIFQNVTLLTKGLLSGEKCHKSVISNDNINLSVFEIYLDKLQ